MLIGNMFFYKNKSVLNALGIVKHFTTNHYALKHVTVALDCGKLRGIKSKLWNGSTYYSFKGIPYAQPPVGKLRFKAPFPPEPWQGTYDAFEHGPICPQIKTNDKDIHKRNEDCLYLNVYTKSLDRNSKLPVMILIHAGAYLSGSGNTDIYGPDFLLQHDVLLVTFNYRLEALGFLCLDTPEIPGNAGMKDQIAAFRWVQRNVENLGGDPNNVTIFGGSAGGTSVTYHLLSPLSTGLFHKAIAQSGICLTDWAQGKNGRDRATRVAKYLGQETNNTSELTDLFQSIPVEKLVKITFKSMTEDEKHRGYPTHFVPVVEKEFENVEAFITKEPIDLLLSGQINKVPLITGYNSSEGLFTTAYQIEKLNFMNNHLSYYVPREMANVVSTGKLVDFGNRIRRFYAGDRKLTEEDVDIIMNLHSDIHFVYNCHRFCQFYSTRCESIFTYRFDCETDLNVQKKSLGFEHCRGACHVDELYYLFKNDMNKDAYERQEKLREIVFKVTKLWTDFAKTGNPTPKNILGFNWTPYTRRGKEYLIINDNFRMGTFADKERVEFWNSLYKEAGLPYIISEC